MFGTTIQALGENRGMLRNPEFIGSFRVTPMGEIFHRAPGFPVIGSTQIFDLHKIS
jgi:hypothetical protein